MRPKRKDESAKRRNDEIVIRRKKRMEKGKKLRKNDVNVRNVSVVKGKKKRNANVVLKKRSKKNLWTSPVLRMRKVRKRVLKRPK